MNQENGFCERSCEDFAGNSHILLKESWILGMMRWLI